MTQPLRAVLLAMNGTLLDTAPDLVGAVKRAAPRGRLARRRRPSMNDGAVWLALTVGVALGALAALLWRARREQFLEDRNGAAAGAPQEREMLNAEREQALSRAREQLQGVFANSPATACKAIARYSCSWRVNGSPASNRTPRRR